MKIRRTLAATAASVAVAAMIIVGTAAPASADAPIVIPTCENMFSANPTYWDTFAGINHDTAVPYTATPPLYGSDLPIPKALQRIWGATTCTWRLAHGKTTENFTISEVAMTKARSAILRRWYAYRGIVGVDREATLGGVFYMVSPHQYDVLMHGRVWISITDRNTSVEGYTMQDATYTIALLNPGIGVGTL